MQEIKKGDKLYYARILPITGIYDVCDLIVRTVTDDWFVGVDKRDKHAYLFGSNAFRRNIYREREMALNAVRKAEENRLQINDETYYEDY